MSALTASNSDEWIASFVGRKCRCGCEQQATHVFIGNEFGKPYPPEPCCFTAGKYVEECAADSGDEFTLIKLP